jgi:hypothetical protein
VVHRKRGGNLILLYASLFLRLRESISGVIVMIGFGHKPVASSQITCCSSIDKQEQSWKVGAKDIGEGTRTEREMLEYHDLPDGWQRGGNGISLVVLYLSCSEACLFPIAYDVGLKLFYLQARLRDSTFIFAFKGDAV